MQQVPRVNDFVVNDVVGCHFPLGTREPKCVRRSPDTDPLRRHSTRRAQPTPRVWVSRDGLRLAREPPARPPWTPPRSKAAKRKLAACDKRSSQYRKALDSGADPAVVAGWMSEVQGERLKAEVDLADAQPATKLSIKQAHTLVKRLGNIPAVLGDADPKLKSQLYKELGIGVTYDHTTRTVTAWAKVSVGGRDR
jgi:hypothetical protein